MRLRRKVIAVIESIRTAVSDRHYPISLIISRPPRQSPVSLIYCMLPTVRQVIITAVVRKIAVWMHLVQVMPLALRERKRH